MRSPSLVLEPRLDDLGSPVAQAHRARPPGLRADGAWAPSSPASRASASRASREKFSCEVAVADALGLAELDDAAVLEQQRAVAEALHRVHVVRDEEDRRAAAADARELVVALLLEGGVADGEHLVDEQDVGVDLDHHREGQAHEHARRVVLELEVDELAQLGEVDDAVEARARLARREPEHRRVEHHVVVRGEVQVEADAELDERRHPPVDVDLPAVGAVDPGQALQQRRLARAVAPDDPEELARARPRTRRRAARAGRRGPRCGTGAAHAP